MKKPSFNSTILSSEDYDSFKLIDANRKTSAPHIARLKRSFQDNGFLICPLIVNEKHEIIDGQNRFMALKELKMPIYYIKAYGYGLKEIKVLNANQEKWKAKDNLHSYISQGKEPYIAYKKFQESFPKLNHATCIKILSGRRSNKNEYVDGFRLNARDFAEGKLQIPNIKKSYATARKIYDFQPFFEKFNDNQFVTALLAIFEVEGYDHELMLKKLSIDTGTLVPCKNSTQYKQKLQEIYNYKNRSKLYFRD